MSTVASSNSDLTINADGSGNDIKFQSNGTEVGSINSSGTMTATAFAGDGSALTGTSSGKVLQVVSTTKSSTWSSNSNSFVDITGLSASITPSATSSKVLVIINVSESSSTGLRSFNLIRGGNASLGMGDAASNRTRAMIGAYTGNADATHSMVSHCGQYLDSPNTTSATTYQLQARAQSGYTVYINRSQSDTDTADIIRSSSTITLMEIGA